jgi:glycosyltransferase involved in cell wall biosynthesis
MKPSLSEVGSPLISIIMNCYNGEKYLREALDSVLKQTYYNWELIFWDNQSRDSSAIIVQSYDDKRFKYKLTDSFTPLGEARNQAIQNAKGEFIAFLDCDDLWMPEKLMKQIPLFSDSKVGLVICDTYFFNESKILKQLYSKKKPPVGNVFKKLLGEYFVSLETAVIRRAALESLDHWFDPRFDVIEEYDLFARLGYSWRLDFVDEVLAKWRVHGKSWTWSQSELFPKERKLMLEKLKNIIPDFAKSYTEEIKYIECTCALEEALIAWKGRNNLSARKLLNPYKSAGLKWFIIYYMTWLPFQFFQLLQNMRGVVRPE